MVSGDSGKHLAGSRKASRTSDIRNESAMRLKGARRTPARPQRGPKIHKPKSTTKHLAVARTPGHPEARSREAQGLCFEGIVCWQGELGKKVRSSNLRCFFPEACFWRLYSSHDIPPTHKGGATTDSSGRIVAIRGLIIDNAGPKSQVHMGTDGGSGFPTERKRLLPVSGKQTPIEPL